MNFRELCEELARQEMIVNQDSFNTTEEAMEIVLANDEDDVYDEDVGDLYKALNACTIWDCHEDRLAEAVKAITGLDLVTASLSDLTEFWFRTPGIQEYP